jgi:hypothetical protein
MSGNVERLLYYEREYLRSFDFIAEQNYHMEMRRRLNIALHLWGIVDGLEVLQGELVPGALPEVYVSTGMAIDAYGREILLLSPYPLTEDDIRNNHISTPGNYQVWIAYDREPATPPSQGYRLCDVELKDQFTRWREFARIIITKSNLRAGLTEPQVFDPLSDDPKNFPWPLLLGTVDIGLNSSNQPFFSSIVTSPGQREYIGLRTQRITAPVARETQTAVDKARPITVESDMRETKNLIVGTDFTIDQSKVKPPPVIPPDFPGPEGNLKVENNLFLKGDLYKSRGDEWLALREYIQDLIPETQMKTITLPTAPTLADPSNGTETITIVSNVLKKPSSATVFVAISGIKWKSKTDLTTWWDNLTSGGPVQIEVSAGPPVKKAATDNEFEVGISWAVGPKSAAGAANNPPEMINVESLSVSYIAVFNP